TAQTMSSHVLPMPSKSLSMHVLLCRSARNRVLCNALSPCGWSAYVYIAFCDVLDKLDDPRRLTSGAPALAARALDHRERNALRGREGLHFFEQRRFVTRPDADDDCHGPVRFSPVRKHCPHGRDADASSNEHGTVTIPRRSCEDAKRALDEDTCAYGESGERARAVADSLRGEPQSVGCHLGDRERVGGAPALTVDEAPQEELPWLHAETLDIVSG